MNFLFCRTLLPVSSKLKIRYNTLLKYSLSNHCQFILLQSYKSDNLKTNLSKGHALPRPDKIKIIEYLTKQLNCSLNDAELLYSDYYGFLIGNYTNLSNAILLLEDSGFSKHILVDNFWILLYGKDELKSRLDLIKTWRFTDPNNGIYILKLPMVKLLKHTSQARFELNVLNSKNRITYFSSFVECEERRACQLFVKYQFMMTIKLESFKSILAMVKDQGVLTEDLLNDLWVFRYSPQFIIKRIKHLDDIEAKAKCEVIKPWMLRCTDVVLNRYFEIKEENLAALGVYSNLKDLLMNELELPAACVEDMIFKHPPLAKISYAKVRDMIEFLKAEGFTSNMIYQVPRVLCHKQATLVARMVELKKISPNLINLHNLCRNKKDYISFLNKMTL